jgi:hypothetical protein
MDKSCGPPFNNLTSHCRGSRSAPGAHRDNFCCAIYVSYCMKRLLLESRFALYNALRVHARSKSRTRALGERFSDKYEKRRTEWWRIQSAAKSSLKKRLQKPPKRTVNFKIFYELSRAFQFNIPKNIIAFISVFPLVNFVKWNEPVCHNDSEIIRNH